MIKPLAPGEAVSFTVPGGPVGYTRMTYASKWTPAAKKYHAYMNIVQIEARRAGLKLPLEASEGSEIDVQTMAVFKDRRHPDPGNVQKAIEDALFHGSKSGDKYVSGSYSWPTYGKESSVRVTVTRCGESP